MSQGRLIPSARFLKLLGAGAAVLLLVPIVPELGLAVLGFDLLLVVFFFWDAGSVPGLDAVGVERRLPVTLSLGEKNRCEVRISNFTERSVSGRMRFCLPEGLSTDKEMCPISMEPYGASVADFDIFARRRGFFELEPLYLRMRGMMGLAERDYAFDASRTVKVYPSLLGIGRYELMARKSHLAQIGFRQMRKIGAGTEFEKLREYLPDDDYRHINWKATAKKRRPITQEYQIERSQNIFICIDTSRYMAYRAGRLTKLDYAVNASLMLAHVARKFDDNVGLMVFSDRVRLYHPPRKTGGIFASLVDALYRVEPERCAVEYGEAFRTLSTRQKRRSLVVLFTDFFDPRDGEELLKFVPLMGRRHVIICITVRDERIAALARREPEKVEEAFDRYAAGEVLAERERIHGILRNRGAFVADPEPSELTVAAVNQYLQVKTRQLI
jgi:uncharacterized protein (DUF58 family)